MDIWFALHTGEVWPDPAFEPLIMGISFSLTGPPLGILEATKQGGGNWMQPVSDV
jgi:hypothetical protein